MLKHLRKFETILDGCEFVLSSFRDDKDFKALLCEITGEGVFWVGFDEKRENVNFYQLMDLPPQT